MISEMNHFHVGLKVGSMVKSDAMISYRLPVYCKPSKINNRHDRDTVMLGQQGLTLEEQSKSEI